MPPNVALRRRADIDRKPDAVRLQISVELIQHDAGFDGRRQRFAIEVQHAIQVLAVVDDQRRTHRLPALRTARAARQHRDAELTADIEGGPDVVVAGRHQHRDRLDLVDRSVGRVAAARSAVDQHRARHGVAQTPRELGIRARRMKDQRLRDGGAHRARGLNSIDLVR